MYTFTIQHPAPPEVVTDREAIRRTPRFGKWPRSGFSNWNSLIWRSVSPKSGRGNADSKLAGDADRSVSLSHQGIAELSGDW